MAKKGGGSSPSNTTSTVTQTTLPAYAEPYVKRVMSEAEAISNRPYEAYSGPRIAPFGADQLQAFDMARGASDVGTSQFNMGDANTGIAALNMGNAQYNPTYSASTYNPGSFTADQATTGTWDTAAAQQYMSPYLSQVLDQITARQEQNYGMAKLARDAQQKKAGVFGGYNQGVENAVARGQHEMNLGDLIAQNLNTGYNNAFQMYNADQGRGLEAMLANQGANLEAQRMGEASRQFGANFDESSRRELDANALRKGQFDMSQAQGLAAIGAQQYGQGAQRQDSYLKGLDALRSTGLDQQRQTQASLDQAYTDFVNQRDYEKNNLTWLNNIVRGNVASANSNVVNQEAYNPYTQMLGLGIGAVGLANALNGGGSGATA